jgi:nitrate reductase gamma subunit
MGTLAGVVMTAGLAILIARRAGNRRVAATTTTIDVAVMLLLGFVVLTGMWNTSFHNLIDGGYDYRETVSPWFRDLFLLAPDAAHMTEAAVPLSYQLHAIAAWLLFMVWPFSRLVHAWSIPIAYLRRPPIVYRSRAPRNVRAGAGGVASPTESRVHVQS